MNNNNVPDPVTAHTPPLGYKVLTPLYDFVIASLTREDVWRKAFVNEIAPHPEDYILDIGSGTGSLAIALCRQSPGIRYIGVDPDSQAVLLARKKTARAGVDMRFVTGFFSSEKPYFDQEPDKIISSLVLHQVPIAEKKRIVEQIYISLRQGGFVYIADYGFQNSGLMRFLFRITVQALDGIDDTQPNADGIISEILKESGFKDVLECVRIPTLTGTISIYRGQKP